MTTDSLSLNTPTRLAVRSVGILALFWILSFALVQISQRVFAVGQIAEVGQLLAALGAMFLARRIEATPALYILIVVTAFSSAEVIVHLIYGIDKLQGGPTHMAVFASAAIAVVLSAWLGRRVATKRN